LGTRRGHDDPWPADRRFTGDPVLPGNAAAPTIAGSVDADRDRHAEIFVKVSSGASTQFWTICDEAQFVTVSEGVETPGYTTWTYKSDTFARSGAELVPVSKRTGQVTSAQPASPPAEYSGVSCGDLPQYAPLYPPSTS
jgi:hypothetical protein